MKRVNWRAAVEPGGLLLLCLLAYAPLIPALGAYWDDWPSRWFLHAFGPGIFPTAFAIDRPAQGWLFVPTTAIFGQWMPGWQAFGILARWLSGLMLWRLLALVWPQHASKTAWVAALFVVYPGFSQQFIPITYGHQFLVYSAFLASLGLMIAALRRPQRFWPLTAAALGLAVWSMFALEYFFGLELLRPALLWIAANNPLQPGESAAQRLRKVLLHWLPYAAAAGLFLAWRVSIPTPRGNIVLFERLAANPGATLAALGATILSDVFSAAAAAWGRLFEAFNFKDAQPALWAAVVVMAAAGGGLAYKLFQSQHGPGKQPEASVGKADVSFFSGWPVQAILLGGYALLIAGWPVWVTDLRMDLEFPWDRFTLPFMPGAALLAGGLIGLLRRKRMQAVFLAALIGLSAGAHLNFAARYAAEWKMQKDFAWQLAWRAPAIQPGTLLLVPGLPFPFSTDNSLTAPLNWMYAPQSHSTQMPYLMVSLDARLGGGLKSLEPDTPVAEEYRAARFEGSTAQALVLFYEPPRCLKVIDPKIDGDLPNKPKYLVGAMPLSRPELIEAQPAAGTMETVRRLFGEEPQHGWCYYVQKADLAAFQGDWPEVIRLAELAMQDRPQLKRHQAYETLAFIRGYAYTGEWRQALALSRLSAEAFSDKMPAILCDLWYEMGKAVEATAESAAAQSQAAQLFNCPAR